MVRHNLARDASCGEEEEEGNLLSSPLEGQLGSAGMPVQIQ